MDHCITSCSLLQLHCIKSLFVLSFHHYIQLSWICSMQLLKECEGNQHFQLDQLAVTSFGTNNWTSIESLSYQCLNLTKIENLTLDRKRLIQSIILQPTLTSWCQYHTAYNRVLQNSKTAYFEDKSLQHFAAVADLHGCWQVILYFFYILLCSYDCSFGNSTIEYNLLSVQFHLCHSNTVIAYQARIVLECLIFEIGNISNKQSSFDGF